MPIRHRLLLLPLLATIAGCSKAEPGVYALPVATVFERLSAKDMSDFRTARQCGILIHFTVTGLANDYVRWAVTSGGSQVASFTAKLTPVDGDKTRIVVDVPAAPDGGEIYDGTKFYKRPALHQPLRPAIEELINARLEQRPYDVWRIPDDVRAKDDICSIQRGGLEGGSARFKADGKDNDGRGSRKSAPDYVPGKPMTNAEPTR